MTDDCELELVSAALDSELDGAEQARLDALLKDSAEARQFKSDLEQIEAVLSSIPALEPPEFLKASIMSRLKVARREVSVIKWLLPMLPAAGFRYALAAAAGALVVAVFFNGQTMLLNETDISSLVGTMSPGISSVDADLVDSLSIRGDGFESAVRLQRSKDFMVLVVQVDAAATVDISVDLADAGLEPGAVAQIGSEFESITITGQSLQLRAIGKQRMSILLRRVDDMVLAGEANISVEFSREGNLLQRGALTATLKGVKQ